MIKPMKQKRCPHCLEMFEPKRIGFAVTKICGSAACKLDAAQNYESKISKPKPAKKKPKTLGKLKKELWDIFSLHQKLVHSSDGEWCQCYTCDKPLKIGTSDCHGGHCLSKAGNPNLYFDERATRPQCYKCNVHYGGMHYEFNERLKQEIGMNSWQDMYDNRQKVSKRSRQWFDEQIAHYRNEVNRLKILRSAGAPTAPSVGVIR